MGGGPMPYVLDIGPYLSVLEDRLADSVSRVAFLRKLRGPELLSSFVGLDSANLAGDGHDFDYRVKILNSKWFGMVPQGRNGWVKQPHVFPTGFWKGYQGDPESILREGLERAIEVSLGVDYGADPIIPTHNLPIDINWVCQGPFFQCWVTWQKSPRSPSGRVSLMITTPAADGLEVEAKITRPVTKAGYAYPVPSNAWNAAHGVLVIGHADYTKKTTYSTTGSTLGVIREPHIEWRAKQPAVICVAPAEWEGGVLAAGHPYVPPGP
jgi:hypothetical protein